MLIYISKKKCYNFIGDNMFFRKKAVLLIHGFVGGIYDYGNLQNELQVNRKFDVYTFTLPGHEKNVVKDVKYEEVLKINPQHEDAKFNLEYLKQQQQQNQQQQNQSSQQNKDSENQEQSGEQNNNDQGQDNNQNNNQNNENGDEQKQQQQQMNNQQQADNNQEEKQNNSSQPQENNDKAHKNSFLNFL